MSLAQSLLTELEPESAASRRLLERIPDERLDFRPHERSQTLGELATHLANIYRWGTLTVAEEEFDMAPGGVPVESPALARSTTELVDTLDATTASLRDALATASDEALMQTWALRNNGQALFEMPRISVLRSFIFNHAIHHRGQLSVYLRLCDVPLPEIYGPTADSAR